MKTENVPARHAVTPAPEEQAFRFANGERARSLADLAALLRRLPDHVLDYHRAHYAAWIENVVGDAPLAERFRHFGASDMDTAEYRRVLADLSDARLAELAAPRAPPAEKGPRRATVLRE